MYTSDTSKQIPQSATTLFNEEMQKIVLLAQRLKYDKAHATPFISLLSHDLLATDVFAKRSIKPDHYQILPGGNVNADTWQLYADTQGFYIFAGKVMLAMYLLLAEASGSAVKKELRPYINSHGAFMNFVTSRQSDLSELLRMNISHSLILLDRCVYRKRNKMIEHWTDNKHQRDLFPCYYLIDAPIVYFINNDTFDDYVKSNNVDIAVNSHLARVRGIKVDQSTGTAEKLAILDYLYPKLPKNTHESLDELINPEHIVVLSVSPHLVAALRKFMNDIFGAIDTLTSS